MSTNEAQAKVSNVSSEIGNTDYTNFTDHQITYSPWYTYSSPGQREAESDEKLHWLRGFIEGAANKDGALNKKAVDRILEVIDW